MKLHYVENCIRYLVYSHSDPKKYEPFSVGLFLNPRGEVDYLAWKGKDFSTFAQERTKIVRSPRPGKRGHLPYTLLLLPRGGARNCDINLTEPLMLGDCGFARKFLGSSTWAADI